MKSPKSISQPQIKIATRFHQLLDLEKGERLLMGINYREAKNGSLVVLLHGLGSKKDSFLDIWNKRELKNFGLLIPDLIGFGESSKPKAFAYDLESQAFAVKKVLERMPYQKLHIVGHSMGGGIGLLLAEKLKQVDSFIGIEPVFTIDDCSVSKRAVAVSFEDFEAAGFDKLKQSMKNSKDKGTQLRLAWLKQCDPSVYYKSGKSLISWAESNELLHMFKRFSGPKLFVYGDKNKDLQVLKELDESQKIKINESGHFVMNDNPEDFYATLASVLQ